MASLPGFFSTLFNLALPITLQNLLQTFINMLDTVMVGRLGSVEIAAVGLGNQIFFMLNMVLFGISSGGSIFFAQFWGKGDVASIRKTLGITLLLSLVVATVFFVGAAFFPATLIGLYSHDEQVIALGARYLQIAGLCYPFMAIGFAYQFSFRGTGHVRLPMVSTAAGLITNATANLLCIFGAQFTFGTVTIAIPALGVVGAAIATVLARIVECVITVSYSYTHHFESASHPRLLFSFDRKFFLRYIRIAVPVIINETIWGLGITVQNSIFSHAGTDAIASFNITGTISQLTWVFFIGMGNGASIILGKKVGAHQEAEARQYAYRFAWFMPLAAAFISLLLIPLSLLLPHLFNVAPHIIRQAQYMMYVLACSYPLNAFNMFFIVGLSRSGGDTVYGAVNDTLWMWCVALPLAACAAFLWHAEPYIIYLCLLSEQILKLTAGLLRLHSGKWLRNVTE